ncbi:MAG: GlsB/YeaQ/YmgE family stress response membrane protein, partial [Pseudomonadota bacterium]
GVPPDVVVSLAAVGIMMFFALAALWRRRRPPLSRSAIRFYALSGLAGFIADKVMKRGNGLLMNVLIGIAGSFVGGFLSGIVGISAGGFVGNLIIATVGAIIFLWVYDQMRKN